MITNTHLHHVSRRQHLKTLGGLGLFGLAPRGVFSADETAGVRHVLFPLGKAPDLKPGDEMLTGFLRFGWKSFAVGGEDVAAQRALAVLTNHLTPDGLLGGAAQSNKGGNALQEGSCRTIYRKHLSNPVGWDFKGQGRFSMLGWGDWLPVAGE